MHAELVSGLQPNWTFTAGSGDGDSAGTNPVSFSVLAAANTDPAITTDDVAIDPATNDTHLFARTASGAAAYYFRPNGGAFSSPTFVMASVLRARLIELADGRLVLMYGRNGKGLFYRVAPPRSAGASVQWPALPEVAVPLPAGYANVQAIYTESAIYERTPPTSLNVAIVGDTNEREVLHVAVAL